MQDENKKQEKAMKKSMNMMIAAWLCAILAGCGYPTAKDGTTIDEGCFVSLKVRTIRGHDYLVATYVGHGVSVVHAESCPCGIQRCYNIEELVTTNRFSQTAFQ